MRVIACPLQYACFVTHASCVLGFACQVVAGFSDSVIRIWNLKAGGSQVDGSGVGGLVAGDEDAPMGEPVAPTHLASDERNCQVLVGHKAAVCALCLSDDATYLLSGGMDGVIRLWVVGTQHTAVRVCELPLP